MEKIEFAYVNTFGFQKNKNLFVFKLLGRDQEFYIALDNLAAKTWIVKIIQCYREHVNLSFVFDSQFHVLNID